MAYTKRKDGRYQVNVHIGNGKYKTLTASTVKELKKKENELRLKLSQGINIDRSNDTLARWASLFLKMREMKLTSREYRIFATRLNYFVNKLGAHKLNKISITDIDPLITALAVENPTTGKPSSKKTLKAYLYDLSMLFEYAIKARAIQFNPCKYIDIPEDAPKQIRRNLTLEQQKQIMLTEGPMQTACFIMLFAGLRRGEVCALQWTDIDLVNKTITVNKSLDMSTGLIKSPKTQAAYRTISIPEVLVDHLSKLKRDSLFVVTNKRGKLYTDKLWSLSWDRYLNDISKKFGAIVYDMDGNEKRMPVERFTAHRLRHTYCTNLSFSGVNLKEAQALMGHADSRTTLNVYTHAGVDTHKEAVSQLDRLIKKNFA